MNDRAAIQRVLDAPCRACVEAVETLASALLRADHARSPLQHHHTLESIEPVESASSIGQIALHLCVRLLEVEALPNTAPPVTWLEFLKHSERLERAICRDDEPGLARGLVQTLHEGSLRLALDRLRWATVTLERAGFDDPVGTLYESVLGLVPKIESDGRLTLQPASQSRRKLAGAYYTPTDLIDHLVTLSIEPLLAERTQGRLRTADDIGWLRICDPSSGSGRFLVAAARYLTEHLAAARTSGSEQASNAQVIARSIYAVDRDPIAIEITRFRLWAESGFDDETARSLRAHCRVGDALVGSPVDPDLNQAAADDWCTKAGDGLGDGLFHWHQSFPDVFPPSDQDRSLPVGFDAIVGNPPFLSQLASATALDARAAGVIKAWSKGVIQRYADPSVAFLLRALDLVRSGGRVALLQPLSFLASRDAELPRKTLAARASLEAVWFSTTPVFPGADVLTCAPILAAGHEGKLSVNRSIGVPAEAAGTLSVSRSDLLERRTWSFIMADVLGIPAVSIRPGAVLGDLAAATADFRDQYYGLDGFLVDREAAPDDTHPRLITAGLIDPAECRWGQATTRVLKRQWTAPRIDRAGMDRRGTLGPWMRSRLVPKLLIATQTRVIEVIADEQGRLVPSTPVLTVVPKSEADLWRLGAALTSPVCSAIGLTEFGGAAFTGDTIKLAAKQLLTLPMPTESEPWRKAADEFRLASHATSLAARRQHLHHCAVASLDAYGIAADERERLLTWWWTRLPDRARAG